MRRGKYVRGFLVLCFIGVTVTGASGASLFESFWRQAQQEASKIQEVILGAGVYYATSPYIDVDEDLAPIPLVIAEYGRWYIDGSKVGFLFTDEGAVKLSAVLAPRFQGYEDDDSRVLSGMDDRDWSLDGGMRLEWKNNLCVLNLAGLADLLNTHQGQELRLVVSREFRGGFLTPRLGISWQSAELVDYYYGVSGNEATAVRPVYQPDSTVNYLAGVRIAYPLGEQWALIADAGCEIYGPGITKSPIVDADEQFAYLLGAIYRF